MAINFQGAGAPSHSDFTFKNYSASTDIAANVAVKMDTTNVLNGTDNATWGTVDTPGVIPVTGDGQLVVGVTMEIIKAGQTGRVRTAGIAPMLADGAITAGVAVMASSTALKVGFAKAQTAALAQIGYSLNTTANDSEPVLVLVAIAKNA